MYVRVGMYVRYIDVKEVCRKTIETAFFLMIVQTCFLQAMIQDAEALRSIHR